MDSVTRKTSSPARVGVTVVNNQVSNPSVTTKPTNVGSSGAYIYPPAAPTNLPRPATPTTITFPKEGDIFNAQTAPEGSITITGTAVKTSLIKTMNIVTSAVGKELPV